jgi:hypothetical protein
MQNNDENRNVGENRCRDESAECLGVLEIRIGIMEFKFAGVSTPQVLR